MAYVKGNPKTKKQVKQWIAEGKFITVFETGIGDAPRDGTVYLEGPYFPKPHTWYGEGTMKDGKLVSIR